MGPPAVHASGDTIQVLNNNAERCRLTRFGNRPPHLQAKIICTPYDDQTKSLRAGQSNQLSCRVTDCDFNNSTQRFGAIMHSDFAL